MNIAKKLMICNLILGNIPIIYGSRNISKITKRIASAMRLYSFKQRLKYKCSVNNVSYGEINEWNTSKMCSVCGNIHENLGSNKIYGCEKCKTKMNRDINGARNIHIKAIKK